MKVAAFSIVGFAVGCVIGFAWSKSTKSHLSENINVATEGGTVTVTANLGAAAQAGASNMVADFLRDL